MELEWVDTFLAVADAGSFTRAAEALFISQSVVSKHIQKLEQALGTPLFDRTRRRICLTEAGSRVYPLARTLAQQYRRMARAAAEGSRLRLALLPVADCYGLPQLLADFARSSGLQPLLEEEENAAMPSLLARGGCDGAFFRVPADEPLPPGGIPLYRDRLVLVLPAGHPLAGADRPLPLARFAQTPFLLLNAGTGLLAASTALCRRAGFRPQVAYTGASGGNIARMVRSGAGVALLAEGVARQYRGNGLAVADVTPTCESLLVFCPAPGSAQTPGIRALTAFLHRRASQAPAELS